MRLPNTMHTSRPWRIHEITPDFRLEDVWGVEGTGSAEDFPRLVDDLAAGDPSQSPSAAVRGLFALRWKLGQLLGLDGPDDELGPGTPTLRDRLPPDLRETPGPEFEALPFTSLYLTDVEFAAEIANRTMHGVMHIGRVEDPAGDDSLQMAVLVKPNGLLGRGYMAAIKPFRHLVIYPAITREMEQRLRARRGRSRTTELSAAHRP